MGIASSAIYSGLEELSWTLPTAVKFFCNETNDFALSGTVLMTTHRVVATRLLTRTVPIYCVVIYVTGLEAETPTTSLTNQHSVI
jgi:hypothetical protein